MDDGSPSPRKRDVFEGDNHDLRVVSTLESFRLNAPARCPFFAYFLWASKESKLTKIKFNFEREKFTNTL